MIAALLIAAAATVLPPGFPAATPVTIEQVRADPRRWDGQWVELEGWIHRCSPLDCVLAEHPGNQGMTLGFDSIESFDRWAAPIAPAKVVVVARIDADCLINMCTDRAPVLREPFVEVLRRDISDPAKED